MNRFLRYWREVLRLAVAETLASNNWTLPRTVRKLGVLVATVVLIVVLGGFESLHSRALYVFPLLGAVGVLLLGEVLWRVLAIPVRIDGEQKAKIASLSERRTRLANTEQGLAQLKHEFEAAKDLLGRLKEATSEADILRVQKDAVDWDGRVRGKLEAFEPTEAFAFTSIADPPKFREPLDLGFVVLDWDEGHQRALEEFVTAKRSKLRLILLRLEGKAIAQDRGSV